MSAETPPQALQVLDVSKRFGLTRALDGVSFEAGRGRVHALLGGNGCGKSTLIKILAGVQVADAGEFRVGDRVLDAQRIVPSEARDAGLRFVHQQASTCPDLTVAENLALGHGFVTGPGGRIRWRAHERHATAVLERFRIDARPRQQLGMLTPAKQTMVAIARALQDLEEGHHGILVLDEPTASLPAGEVRLLLGAVREYAERGETILYVSHRLEEVTEVADAATVLRDGRVAEELTAGEITHERLVHAIVGRALTPLAPAPRTDAGAQTPALRVRELRGGAVRSVDFDVHRGEILGVAGLLGSGRTTLLQLLFGAVEREAGSVRLDDEEVRFSRTLQAIRAGVAYVPEDRARQAMFPGMTVQENLSIAVTSQYWRGGRLRWGREQADAKRLMADYRVRAASPRAPLASLSGGNQQKVILARWMRRAPRVLLLDEPTQGVDIGARMEIYALIRQAAEAGTAVVLASSDLEELALLSTRVLVLRRGHCVGELSGDEITDETLNQILLHEEARPA